MDRNAILRELGLGPIWKLRQSASAEAIAIEPTPSAAEAVPAIASEVPVVTSGPELSTARSPDANIDKAVPVDQMDWETLAATVADCRKCKLCERRKQAVLGAGDRNADWLFVGEGPGADEDEKGEPFVGQAGKLLDNMLAAIGLRRGNDVYIANAVKCRPPNNRTPEVEETAACLPYLERQIDLIRPRLIVALGRPAAATLLGTEIKIGAARGKLFEHRGIPVVVTYHPAYLLRNLHDKALSWEDLLFMRRTMRGFKAAGS